jgi:hypothetical protein
VAVRVLCRREGIKTKPGAFYAWTKDGDGIRDATRHETEHIERENIDLKHVVADLSPLPGDRSNSQLSNEPCHPNRSPIITDGLHLFVMWIRSVILLQPQFSK